MRFVGFCIDLLRKTSNFELKLRSKVYFYNIIATFKGFLEGFHSTFLVCLHSSCRKTTELDRDFIKFQSFFGTFWMGFHSTPFLCLHSSCRKLRESHQISIRFQSLFDIFWQDFIRYLWSLYIPGLHN